MAQFETAMSAPHTAGIATDLVWEVVEERPTPDRFSGALSRGLNRLAELAVTVGMVSLVALIFVQVAARYAFNSSLVWSEEAARYIFVWLVLLGASIGIHHDSHPGVMLVVSHLPAPTRRVVRLLALGISSGFFAVLTWYGVTQALQSDTEMSAAMGLNMTWPYLAFPIGGALMLVHTLTHAIAVARTTRRVWVGMAVFAAALAITLVIPALLPVEVAVWLVFGGLLALLAMGLPVAVALGAAVYAAVAASGQATLDIVPQRMFGALDSFTIMAVPFFVLVGALMQGGGTSRRLVDFAAALVGWIRGGLGLVDIVASLLFADISGSAVADTAAIGSVMVPGLLKCGYSPPYATALQAAAGSLGLLFPPSSTMIIFAMVAQISVARLFMASFGPGFLVAFSFLLVHYITALRRGYPAERWLGVRRLGGSFGTSFPALLTPVLILWGILGGVFTPTEAGVIAVAYILLISLVVYRDLSPRELGPIMVNASVLTSRVMFILAAAMVFGWFLVINQVPQAVAAMLLSMTSNPFLLLILINLVLVVVHSFLETGSTILIVVPILLPVLQAVGVDPVHFGVVVLLNSAVGILLPPIGIGLYTATSLTGVSLESAARSVLPFVGALLLDLVVVIAIPAIALTLPALVLH